MRGDGCSKYMRDDGCCNILFFFLERTGSDRVSIRLVATRTASTRQQEIHITQRQLT
jgi:hypothetical protein